MKITIDTQVATTKVKKGFKLVRHLVIKAVNKGAKGVAAASLKVYDLTEEKTK